MFFSLSAFNKAGFQTLPATLDPAETSEEVIMPLCKVLVEFHLQNCCVKFQSCSCRRTLEKPRICSKWHLELILGTGGW